MIGMVSLKIPKKKKKRLEFSCMKITSAQDGPTVDHLGSLQIKPAHLHAVLIAIFASRFYLSQRDYFLILLSFIKIFTKIIFCFENL